MYAINPAIAWDTQADGNRTIVEVYVGGVSFKRVYDGTVGAAGNSMASGTAIIKLNAGSYVEIYCYTVNAENVTAASSSLEITKIS